MFDRRAHWQDVYRRKNPTEVSWYQAQPQRSLAMIRASGVARDAPLLEVGAGASLLIDALLEAEYTDLSALDVSGVALERIRQRLGDDAKRVTWHETDVVDFRPQRQYALWHDRAVFHFLTDPTDRCRYVDVLNEALAPGGQVVIATFAPDGPQRCSGLDVIRYGADDIVAALDSGFALAESHFEPHHTPSGAVQNFAYFRLTKQHG